MKRLLFVDCTAIHLKNVFHSTDRKCEYLGRGCSTHTLGAFTNFSEKDDPHPYEAALTDGSKEVVTTNR